MSGVLRKLYKEIVGFIIFQHDPTGYCEAYRLAAKLAS
jgi:hypothetical protein